MYEFYGFQFILSRSFAALIELYVLQVTVLTDCWLNLLGVYGTYVYICTYSLFIHVLNLSRR